MSLSDRIRSEGNIAARPGQMARLHELADEVDTLRALLKAAGHDCDSARRRHIQTLRSWDEMRQRAEAAEAECVRLSLALRQISEQEAAFKPGWIHRAEIARIALAARTKEQES